MLLRAPGLKELPGTASNKELLGVLASLLGARNYQALLVTRNY